MEDFQPRMSVFLFFFEYMKNDIMNNFERKKTEKGGRECMHKGTEVFNIRSYSEL